MLRVGKLTNGHSPSNSTEIWDTELLNMASVIGLGPEPFNPIVDIEAGYYDEYEWNKLPTEIQDEFVVWVCTCPLVPTGIFYHYLTCNFNHHIIPPNDILSPYPGACRTTPPNPRGCFERRVSNKSMCISVLGLCGSYWLAVPQPRNLPHQVFIAASGERADLTIRAENSLVCMGRSENSVWCSAQG